MLGPVRPLGSAIREARQDHSADRPLGTERGLSVGAAARASCRQSSDVRTGRGVACAIVLGAGCRPRGHCEGVRLRGPPPPLIRPDPLQQKEQRGLGVTSQVRAGFLSECMYSRRPGNSDMFRKECFS